MPNIKHVSLDQVESKTQHTPGIALVGVKGDLEMMIEEAFTDMIAHKLFPEETIPDDVFEEYLAVDTGEGKFDVFLVYSPGIYFADKKFNKDIEDWCKKFGGAMTISEYFGSKNENEQIEEMNTFNVKKRKIMKFDDFKKHAALDKDNHEPEKGEHEIVKASMDDREGKKGYADLSTAKSKSIKESEVVEEINEAKKIKLEEEGDKEAPKKAVKMVGDGKNPPAFFIHYSNEYMYMPKPGQMEYFSGAPEKAPVQMEKIVTHWLKVESDWTTAKGIADEIHLEYNPKNPTNSIMNVIIEDRKAGTAYERVLVLRNKIVAEEETLEAGTYANKIYNGIKKEEAA